MNCNGNYNTGNREKVFRLPSDKEEREKWINIILRDNIPDSPNTAVCERHFSPGYMTITKFGRKRPRDPPSIFTCVKPSLIPTIPGPSRPTVRAISTVRNIVPDELDMFLARDTIKCFQELHEKLKKEQVNIDDVDIIWYVIGENMLVFQSRDFEENTSVPRFLLKIKENLTYEGFFCGIKLTITSLSINRVITINSVSKLHEALRYLHSLTKNNKIANIFEHIHAMNPIAMIGDKKYDANTIVRAFEYFSLSRALYSRFMNFLAFLF